MYVGYPVEYEQAFEFIMGRKPGKDEDLMISVELAKKSKHLVLEWIDKNLYVFGVKVDRDDTIDVDRYINLLQVAKYLFYSEIQRLNIDISVVRFAEMEGPETIYKNPVPRVLEYY